MAYPAEITATTLTNQQSIDAIAEAEAGILQCMSNLFFGTGTNFPGTLISDIVTATNITIDEQATLVKDLLCAFACKEFAIADVLNSLACRLAFENRSMIGEECDCGCNKR